MKKKLFALGLALALIFQTVSNNAMATEVGDGIGVNIGITVDNSYDDSSVSVVGKLIIKNKNTGDILYQEDIYPNVDASVVVTVNNVADLVAQYISQVEERAAQKALNYIDADNMPECIVEGDSTPHDNRTYKNVGVGTDNMHMEVDGTFGYTAEYTITLEVLTDKDAVDIIPDNSDQPQPTYAPLPELDEAKGLGIVPIIIITVIITFLVAAALTFYFLKRKKNK